MGGRFYRIRYTFSDDESDDDEFFAPRSIATVSPRYVISSMRQLPGYCPSCKTFSCWCLQTDEAKALIDSIIARLESQLHSELELQG